jgi:hypothetical protein
MNHPARRWFQWRFVMAKKPAQPRRKLVEFDAETWQALDLLTRDSMKTFQELADEAFRDLLRKYGRPTDLKAALRQSARPPQRRVRRHRAADGTDSCVQLCPFIPAHSASRYA